MHPLFLNLIKITAFAASLIGLVLIVDWMADRIYRRLRCLSWRLTVRRTRISPPR